MKYVGYLRWSSDKQAKGSSDDRQRDIIEEYCSQECWTIDRWLTDDGVSASTGANVRLGSLSDFIRMIEVEGGEDYTLLVECQDRLSRLHEFDFFEWFIGVLRTGLTVVFCDNEMVVDGRSIRNQKRQMRRIMDDQEEAHRYTDKLSRRVRKAWMTMREKGMKVHTASTCPAWLRLTDDRMCFTIRPDRAAIVKRMFEEYVAGKGLRQIAKALNEDGVKTFRGGQGWQASAVKAILTSRAVIGEYQHKSRATGETIGDPVADYFPAVISNELFQAAQEPRLRAIQSAKTQGDKFRNLFSDVARCHDCQSKLIFVEKSPRRGGRYTAYLQCDSYARGRGCDQARMIRYQPVEDLVVQTLLSSALDDQHFRADDDIRDHTRKLADLRRSLETVEASISNLMAAVEAGSKTAAKALVAREDEQAQIEEAIAAAENDLAKARGAVSPAEHVKRVSEIAADLRSDDDAVRLHARRVTKIAFNDLIHVFDVRAGKVLARAGRDEKQIGVITLRAGLRGLHLDLSGKVLADVSADGPSWIDPVVEAYYCRQAA